MNNTSKDYIIGNCDNQLLKKQKQELENDILYGEHHDHFVVYPLECGVGKTDAAVKTLAKMVLTTDKNALFVRFSIQDCRDSVEKINRLCENNSVAFAYNNKDVDSYEKFEVQKKLHQTRVLCITHSKYLALQKNKAEKNYFTNGRQILIIDEFISNIEQLKLNIEIINYYKMLFSDDIILSEMYLSITSKLEDYLIAHENDVNRKVLKIEDSSVLGKASNLKKLLKKNLTYDDIRSKIPANDMLRGIKTVTGVCKLIDDIVQFHNKHILYENRNLHTTDFNCKKWLLNNNIILDASGDLQPEYELDSSLYRLVDMEQVLDHSKWIVHNIIANTTTAGKGRIKNFYEVVNKIISENEDCLVISNKAELQLIDADNKIYFGNIIGSNEFSRSKNVIVIQTPNLNDINYILWYLHYRQDDMPDITVESHNVGRGLNSRYKFKSDILEDIRTKWIANELYQGIKRVNRQMIYDTNCFLICNNTDAIELVTLKLKNCTVKTVDSISFEFEYTKQDTYRSEQKKNSLAEKFITLLAEIQDGQHPELLCDNNTCKKKVLREYLGTDNSQKFNNKVLSKTYVLQYCKLRNIDLSGQYIRFSE